jgi:hypothetical protein
VTGAVGIVERGVGNTSIRKFRDEYRFEWDARRLVFNVREPFVSKTSGAEIVSGTIDQETPLEITSLMPQNGVIFSDGIMATSYRRGSGIEVVCEPQPVFDLCVDIRQG